MDEKTFFAGFALSVCYMKTNDNLHLQSDGINIICFF